MATRIESPQKPLQPTMFEKSGLAALAQSYLGKKQSEQKALMSAFPAMVAAKSIQMGKSGEAGAFQLGGQTFKFAPGMDYSTLLNAYKLREAQRVTSAPNMQLMNFAKSEVLTSLGGSQMIGFGDIATEEGQLPIREQFETGWRRRYNELAVPMGYASIPESGVSKGKPTPFTKPAHVPKSVWDSATEQVKAEYFKKLKERTGA